METRLHHGLDLAKNRDQRSRERFVSSLRAYVLMDLAGAMRGEYESRLLPGHLRAGGKAPANGEDVHQIMQPSEIFRHYSSLRCTAQELVWSCVIDAVESSGQELAQAAEKLSADAAEGTLVLDPDLVTPDWAQEVDVHLMPGNYAGVAGATVEPGAIYDNGLNVFAFGAMGKQLNDIGWTMANFVKHRFPDLVVKQVVDIGCTIGHNTLPWKQTFPAADVTGIDLAAGVVKYAHARAVAMGVEARFMQASVENLPLESGCADVVFTSMFLHELPVDVIRTCMREAHRLLRPGGVMIHMELPPNDALSPYDAFYLDWDSHYNAEPHYQKFRDLDYRDLVAQGGFAPDTFFEAVMPRFTYVDEALFTQAIMGDAHFDEDTGRLSNDIQWYGFGAVKTHD